jgi:synaptic vesicle membrane protein VAT-1
MAFNLSYLFDKPELLDEGMKAIMGWISSKELEAPKVTTFPFDKVADAHRAIESGDTTGKLVLVV